MDEDFERNSKNVHFDLEFKLKRSVNCVYFNVKLCRISDARI